MSPTAFGTLSRCHLRVRLSLRFGFQLGRENRPCIHERATLFERIAASVVAFYAAEDMHQGLFSRFALEACLVAGLLRLLRRFLIYWFYCVR